MNLQDRIHNILEDEIAQGGCPLPYGYGLVGGAKKKSKSKKKIIKRKINPNYARLYRDCLKNYKGSKTAKRKTIKRKTTRKGRGMVGGDMDLEDYGYGLVGGAEFYNSGLDEYGMGSKITAWYAQFVKRWRLEYPRAPIPIGFKDFKKLFNSRKKFDYDMFEIRVRKFLKERNMPKTPRTPRTPRTMKFDIEDDEYGPEYAEYYEKFKKVIKDLNSPRMSAKTKVSRAKNYILSQFNPPDLKEKVIMEASKQPDIPDSDLVKLQKEFVKCNESIDMLSRENEHLRRQLTACHTNYPKIMPKEDIIVDVNDDIPLMSTDIPSDLFTPQQSDSLNIDYFGTGFLGGARKKKKTSPWINFVKKVQKSHKGMSYKQALQLASAMRSQFQKKK
jgi:hypothetical protein